MLHSLLVSQAFGDGILPELSQTDTGLTQASSEGFPSGIYNRKPNGVVGFYTYELSGCCKRKRQR